MDKFNHPISYAVISDFTVDGLPQTKLRPCLIIIGSNSCKYCIKLIPEIYKLIKPLNEMGINIIISQAFDGKLKAERAVIKKLPQLLQSNTINLPTLIFIDLNKNKHIWEGYESASNIIQKIKLLDLNKL